MSKHTPGPWDNNSRRTVVRETSTGEWIADVGGHTTPEAHENARLIAAAPELLAAAERVSEAFNREFYNGNAVEEMGGSPIAELRIAIAKARGETS
jgi:hypothetical protein